MNGDQFNHFSAEIRSLRTDLTTRLDKLDDNLDKKPNKDELDAVHTRLTKHQTETDKAVDQLNDFVNNVVSELQEYRDRLVVLEEWRKQQAEKDAERDRKITHRTTLFAGAFAIAAVVLAFLLDKL